MRARDHVGVVGQRAANLVLPLRAETLNHHPRATVEKNAHLRSSPDWCV